MTSDPCFVAPTISEAIISKTRGFFRGSLIENKGVPSVRAKYEWAARYHNSVIENFLKSNPIPTSPDADEIYACAISEAQVLNEYKINIESLTAVPHKLDLEPIRPGT